MVHSSKKASVNAQVRFLPSSKNEPSIEKDVAREDDVMGKEYIDEEEMYILETVKTFSPMEAFLIEQRINAALLG